MDYEKKYNEALERSKELLLGNEHSNTIRSYFEHIFPERRESESEDERIRKWLIKTIHLIGVDKDICADQETMDKAIAWLEKQKINTEGDFGRGYDCGYQAGYAVAMNEMKPKVATATLDSEKQKEQKKEELAYRLNGLMQDYIKEGKDEDEKEHRLKCYQLFWNALEDTSYFEQKEPKQTDLPAGFYYIDLDGNKYYSKEFRYGDMKVKVGEQKPTATINGEPIPTENQSVDIPLAEWSEEDEKMLSDLRNTLGCLMNAGAITFKTKKKFSDWLKSIRPLKLDASKLENFDPADVLDRIKREWPMAWEKVVGKPEWSEEDEHRRKDAIYFLESAMKHYANTSEIEKTIDWLKSLRPDTFQNGNSRPKTSDNWKPSEKKKKETLDGADIGYGLETAIDILENGFTHYQTDDGEYERKQALDVLIFLLNETRKKEDAKLWSKDIVESIVTWATEKLQLYSMKESTPYVEAVKNNAQKVLDWAKEQWPIYYGWKPTEEQMEALKEALETYKGFEEYDAMKSLYNDLKKLM